MGRRGNGEGTIRQRGNTWQGLVMLDGHRYSVSGRTQTEVRRKLRELKSQFARGEVVAPLGLTFEQHVSEWLDASAPSWKPRTEGYYRDVCRVWLVPVFGRKRLQHINSPRVALQFAEWQRDGRASGGTLLNAYKVLHRVMQVGVEWGRLARNPVDSVPAPRAKRARPVLWSEAELRRFLETPATGAFGPLWHFLLGTGCRLGEALALEWGDLDLSRGTVHLTRSSGRLEGREFVTEPKTAAGVRTLRIPLRAIELLRSWKAAQAELRLREGSWEAPGRVFTGAGGRVLTRDAVRWRFRQHVADAGVPLTRLHDLRHLNASLLLSAGVSLPEVARSLGHSSPSVTASVYAHVLGNETTNGPHPLDQTLSS